MYYRLSYLGHGYGPLNGWVLCSAFFLCGKLCRVKSIELDSGYNVTLGKSPSLPGLSFLVICRVVSETVTVAVYGNTDMTTLCAVEHSAQLQKLSFGEQRTRRADSARGAHHLMQWPQSEMLVIDRVH